MAGRRYECRFVDMESLEEMGIQVEQGRIIQLGLSGFEPAVGKPLRVSGIAAKNASFIIIDIYPGEPRGDLPTTVLQLKFDRFESFGHKVDEV